MAYGWDSNRESKSSYCGNCEHHPVESGRRDHRNRGGHLFRRGGRFWGTGNIDVDSFLSAAATTILMQVAVHRCGQQHRTQIPPPIWKAMHESAMEIAMACLLWTWGLRASNHLWLGVASTARAGHQDGQD